MGDPRPRSTVLTAHLEGEAVLLEMDRRSYFRLNETGQAIWRVLEAGGSIEDVVAALTERYEITGADARAEVDRFIAELSSNGIVRDTGA